MLQAVGIEVPKSRLCHSPTEVENAFAEIGPGVVKAQAPTGKRGKAGGIRRVDSREQARAAAEGILGLRIGHHPVDKVLLEARAPVVRELYAAIVNDPDRLLRLPIDIRHGLSAGAVTAALAEFATDNLQDRLRNVLLGLYAVYRDNDAELVEINPLAVTRERQLVALDCKFALDDSAIARQSTLAGRGSPDRLTGLELRGREQGLKFIELEGEVGVLANGAGLTMTTMDAVRHYGGRPANFLEIGGEAYTLGRPALELVLSHPGIKSLLINFCGACARTDIMTGGILEAWEATRPQLPVFFTIHGTGEEEAIAMVRDRLGVGPYEFMDDAVKAAVEAAR